MSRRITKIVLTGGPCAGKSTGQRWIESTFSKFGYKVLFVPETATELITGGVAPWTCGTNGDYQKCNLQLQIEKEKVFEEAAETMDGKILIVCDRGTLDNKAYMTEEEFQAAVAAIHSNEVELRDSYDGVFHLVTAAKGAIEAYTLSNNAARTETPEQAAALDDKLIAAWTGHPHLRVIDNSVEFEDKMKHLVSEIAGLLGEPEPYEIERKYLIEYPDIAMLENLPNCQRVEIIQTYLKCEPGLETRVRQRGANGNYIYFMTTKKEISPLKRVEIERRLSEKEYLSLLMNADTTKHQIRKSRFCLTYQDQYFEIDVYPFWKDKAIVEIELSSEDQKIVFPDFLHIIREVTDDDSYRNYQIASLDI